MRKKQLFATVLLVLTALISFSACTNEKGTLPKKEKTDVESFIAGSPGPDKIIEFIRVNQNSLTKKNADSLVLLLESEQKELLPEISGDFYEEDVQKALMENSTASVSRLLNDSAENGFKIESSEGMYYPVIDYSVYADWSDVVSEDLKSYISIMAKQSDKPTANDAAIVISWDELARRAVEMEAFLERYPGSARFDEISQMYGYYRDFVFYGFNNTPLFDHVSKVIRNDALAGYKNFISEEAESSLSKSLKEFLELAEKNNFKLTTEVEEFRNNLKSEN